MRRLYGITEISEAIGVSRVTVAQWRVRGKLPPPTEVLSMGAVWLAKDIEPWIAAAKEKKGDE